MKNSFLKRSLFAVFLLSLFAISASLSAQDEKSVKKKKDEIPEVEVVEITAKDGVQLRCLFYAGTKGKESIPVIMLHDWDNNRNQFADYAKQLQKSKGFAVIVPDLRGHGESTFTESGDQLDREKWKPSEIATIVADIEACKKFLVGKNNKGELNIDLLSVVAEGVTCYHACQWAVADWQYGYFGGVKQGSDVKSLALLGPQKSYRGLNLTQVAKNELFTGPADSALSMMIMGNSDNGDRSVNESKSIYKNIERIRNANDDDKKFVYFFEYMTRKQTKVVKNQDGNEGGLSDVLAYFIENEAKRFENRHRWQDRSRK